MLEQIIELGKTLTPVRLNSLYNSLDVIEKPNIIRYQDYGAFHGNTDIVGSYVDFRINEKRYTAFFIPAVKTEDNIIDNNDNVIIVSVFDYDNNAIPFMNEYYIDSYRRTFLDYNESVIVNEKYEEEA